MTPDRRNWTDAVRRTLAQGEEQLPENGWERLERELGSEVPAVTTVSSYKIWMKFAAAAAAVLVCVSVGFRILRSDKNVLKRVVMVQEAAVSEQNTDAEVETRSVSDYMIAPSEPLAQVGRSVVRSAVMPQTVAPQTVGDDLEPTTTQQISSAVGSSESSTQRASLSVESSESATRQADSAADSSESATPAVRSSYATADYDGLFADAKPTRRKRKTDVGVFASGVVTGSTTSGVNNHSIMLISQSASVASLRLPYEDYLYRHKQPLGVGLALRIELGVKTGFSVETGLTYTLLRSEVVVPAAVIDLKQNLHMLGVPVRINWDFLRRDRLTLYVGAGVKAETCLSARFGGERVVEENLQWSLAGVVGAQYRLGKTVGIYFEPEVSHYMTRTALQTSYTASPVVLNLRLGLRFSY